VSFLRAHRVCSGILKQNGSAFLHGSLAMLWTRHDFPLFKDSFGKYIVHGRMSARESRVRHDRAPTFEVRNILRQRAPA